MKIDFFKKIDFSKKDFDKEKLYATIVRYANIILFSALIFTEVIIMFNGSYGNLFWAVLGIEVALTVNTAINIWAIKIYNKKIVCYVLDIILLLALTAISGSEYLLTLYTIILSEFYLSMDRLVSGVIMFASSLVFYCVAYGLSFYVLTYRPLSVSAIISQCFNSMVFLSLHFLIENFALVMYRGNIEADKKNKELDETNKKLQSAYEELHQVALLKERQRIAKDIHDTAGHSITICIMQTEAAKVLIDKDLETAKKNIISANIQAKHALEELRESVHLLSGRAEQVTLRDSLLKIITDSVAGTELKFRYEIEDIRLSGDKRRIVENTLKEGISNGLRHGKANAFYFELSEKSGQVAFLLSDNGIGTDIGSIKMGLGLEGLLNRVKELGGEVSFLSEPDDGFEIHMNLPFDKEETI